MPSTQAHTDIPAWVQRDPACFMAWQQDPSWRRSARGAVPPNGRKPGDGGTTGDALRLVAEQQLARSRRAAERQRKEQDAALVWHHAQECICPTCKKQRGEYVPTLGQLQERRKHRRVTGDAWRLSEEALARFAQLNEISCGVDRSDTLPRLKPAFAAHCDAWHLIAAVERLLVERPAQACAWIAHALEERPLVAVAAEEGVVHTTILRRVEQARRALAALHEGHPLPPAPRTRKDSSAVLMRLEQQSREAGKESVARYLYDRMHPL